MISRVAEEIDSFVLTVDEGELSDLILFSTLLTLSTGAIGAATTAIVLCFGPELDDVLRAVATHAA